MKLNDDARFSTICIHAGQEPDPATGAIITPIYQTSTYVQDGLGQPHAGFEYGRTQNPTRMALERNVAAIEAGTAAFAFASGMAAIDTLLTRLESGDHVLVGDNTYGGTFRLFERVRRKFGLDFTYVDTSKPELVEPAIKPNTKYLFIETPTNPMLHVTDIQCVSSIAHRKNVRVVVDNTFASPYIQRPLTLGADIVLHSTTKFLNGHSDSVGGVVILKHQDDVDWMKFVQNAAGAILGPMDSWLILRGTKTLTVRMERTNDNAQHHRRVSRRPSEGEADDLSGPQVASASQPGAEADEGLRRADFVRRRIARQRQDGAEAPDADGARRKPRRRRDADLAPGDHDARLGAARSPRDARHHRRVDSHLGRHRGRRGSAGRSRTGAVGAVAWS